MAKSLSWRVFLAACLALAMGMLLVSPALAQAPANDDFDAAIVIPGLPYTNTQDTTEATSAADDPEPSCVGTSHTVWYQFTPTSDVRLFANTFGSDYDTTLSVWTGTRGALSEVACNDDTFTLQSAVTFDAAAGVTYYFMVGSFFDSPGGLLVFNLDVAPPPLEFDLTVAPFGFVKPSTGVVTITGEVNCSRMAFVDIFVSVEQRIGRFLIRGFGSTFVECEGTTPWSVTLTGENGLFTGGKVEVTVDAFAFTPDGEFASDSEMLTVRLRGKPLNQ